MLNPVAGFDPIKITIYYFTEIKDSIHKETVCVPDPADTVDFFLSRVLFVKDQKCIALW